VHEVVQIDDDGSIEFGSIPVDQSTYQEEESVLSPVKPSDLQNTSGLIRGMGMQVVE